MTDQQFNHESLFRQVKRWLVVARVYQFLILVFLVIGNPSFKFKGYDHDVGSFLAILYVIYLLYVYIFFTGRDKPLSACQDLRESLMDVHRCGQWLKTLRLGLYLKCAFLLLFYSMLVSGRFSLSIRGFHYDLANALIFLVSIIFFIDCRMSTLIIKQLKIYQKS